jgi:hypothetical protein
MYDKTDTELKYLSDVCILKIDYLLPPYEKHNMRIESIVHRF